MTWRRRSWLRCRMQRIWRYACFRAAPWERMRRTTSSSAGSRCSATGRVGAEELRPGVAYGQRIVDARLEQGGGGAVALPRFHLSDALSTAILAFVRPFWIGDDDDLGRLELFQSAIMNLDPEDVLVLEQEIWVGERSDVASVTDLLWPDAPLLKGRADDPRAFVHVDRENGEWFWRVRGDGSVVESEPKVSDWKGPYHNVRMCLEMSRRLPADDR